MDTETITAQRCKHEMTAAWCSLCNPERSVDLSTYRWESDHQSEDIESLVKGFLDRLSAEEVAALCAQLLTDRFSELRRRRTRDIEQRAAAERDTRPSAREKREALNSWSEKAHVDCPWVAPANTKHGRSWRKLSTKEQDARRAEMDEAYARFLAETRNDPEYDTGDMAFRNWQIENSLAAFREKTKQEVLLELTSELLESSFSLGGGTCVTWGEATAEQHQRRFDLLLGQASGNVQSAQRHQAAVAMLQRHKVSTLNEVAA